MHARVHGTRQLRLGKISRCFAQDLIRLPEFSVLALKRLQLLSDIRGNTSPLATVDLGLLDPVQQRVCRAADLCGNRLARRPTRGIIALVIQDQSHGALAHFGGKLVRRFARHGSILFRSWSLLSKRDGLLRSCGWHPASLLGE